MLAPVFIPVPVPTSGLKLVSLVWFSQRAIHFSALGSSVAFAIHRVSCSRFEHYNVFVLLSLEFSSV